MTIKTSGPISLSDIQTEFKGSASPISLSSYYAGTSLVSNPAPTSGFQIGIIPASGPISMGSFYGVAAFAVSLPGAGAYSLELDNTTSAAIGITLYNSGLISIGDSQGQNTQFSGNWGSPTTPNVGNQYWAKFTLTSSTVGPGNGSIGASTGWVNLSSGATITVSAQTTANPRVAVSASRTGVYTVQIASDGAGSNVLATASYSIRISVFFDPNG